MTSTSSSRSPASSLAFFTKLSVSMYPYPKPSGDFASRMRKAWVAWSSPSTSPEDCWRMRARNSFHSTAPLLSASTEATMRASSVGLRFNPNFRRMTPSSEGVTVPSPSTSNIANISRYSWRRASVNCASMLRSFPSFSMSTRNSSQPSSSSPSTSTSPSSRSSSALDGFTPKSRSSTPSSSLLSFPLPSESSLLNSCSIARRRCSSILKASLMFCSIAFVAACSLCLISSPRSWPTPRRYRGGMWGMYSWAPSNQPMIPSRNSSRIRAATACSVINVRIPW
mmetsp:Transcript_50680/g.133571  ORF Transcript_50680/g.133571 Transcript_50680/m.133571 type:complete len:282 (-) Transcript_50680:1374-2219(-)